MERVAGGNSPPHHLRRSVEATVPGVSLPIRTLRPENGITGTCSHGELRLCPDYARSMHDSERGLSRAGSDFCFWDFPTENPVVGTARQSATAGASRPPRKALACAPRSSSPGPNVRREPAASFEHPKRIEVRRSIRQTSGTQMTALVILCAAGAMARFRNTRTTFVHSANRLVALLQLGDAYQAAV